MIVNAAENNSVILDDVISSQLWNDALAEYGKNSNIDISSLPRVHSLDEILGLIETKQSNFSLRRHDGKGLDKIRSAIGKNLLPIQRLIEAVSFSAGKAFAPAEAVFGAVGVLVEAAQRVSDSYDKIIDGFRLMEKYFDQLNILKGKEITSGVKKAVLNVFLKTVIMLMNFYHHISKRRTSHFMKSIFHGEPSDLNSILQSYKEEIEQQRAIIEIESHVNITSLIKRTEASDRKAEKYHEISTNDMRNIDLKVTDLAVQSSTKRENIELVGLLKWLTELNFEESNHKFMKNRHRGTCAWLFQHDTFQDWYTGNKERILWCYGKAGSGKSTITSAVAEHIGASTQTNIPEKGVIGSYRVAVSYFYCDSQNERTHSETELLSVVCKTLANHSFSFAEEVASLRKKVGGRPSEDDLSALIQSNSKHFDRVFVLIDALDECPRSCRNKYAKLVEKLEPYVQFFITSRANIDLSSLIRKPYSSIKIDDVNKLDIESYLRSVIDEDINFNDVIESKPEAKEEIISSIADRVEGMFLLANYQINDVCEQCTIEDVYSCLDSSFNSSINDYYDKNLQRVERLQDKAKKLTKRAIAYIHYAKRPLNMDELCHVLSIRDGDTEINRLRVPVLNILRNHSAGLIVSGENGTLGLVHHTLHEYLNEHPDKLGSEPEADLASACLVYLSFGAFSFGPCKDNDDLRARLQEHPFLEYAAHNLGFHLKRVSEFQDNKRFQIIYDLLKDSDKYSSLLQVLYLPKYWTTKSYNRFRKYFNSLHVAAYLDMHELLPRICEDLGDFVLDISGHLTPLEVAAEQGHHRSLKYILDKVPYIPEYMLDRVLRKAAENGHCPAVEMLLTHHAVKNFLSSSDISTIFCAAVRRRHMDVVLSFWRVYSSNDTDFWNDLDTLSAILAEHVAVEVAQAVLKNCSGDRKSLEKTLMCGAIVYGNKEFWTMLLREGVSFPSWKNIEDAEHICRFVSDDIFSDFSLTNHLLQHGMKADIVTRDGATGLIVASIKGQEEVAQLLLDNGADVNARDFRDFTSLHYAAASGRERLVEMLLENGADPNLTDGRGYLTPLHVATLRKHRSITQLLMSITAGGNEIISVINRLEKENNQLYQLMNVAIERRTIFTDYWRPSSDSSATYGRGQDLLEAGADIDVKHNNGCTALFTAARDDDVETLEFLIDNGATVDKKNRFDETALHATCGFGSGKSASILLDNDAKADVQAFGRTPLLLAAQTGNFSTVKYLAQRGADINWEDCHGRRAIHWCAANGTYDDLENLIREGAHLDVQDYWGKTPLLCSLISHLSKDPFRNTSISPQGFSDVSSSKLELLLQNHADINTISRDGCTLLHYAICSPTNEILCRLLDMRNIRVGPKAKGNFRPIDVAIMTGSVSKIKLLLENGAELMAEEHQCTIDFEFEEDYSGYYAVVDERLFRESGIVYNNLINCLCTSLLEYNWNSSEGDPASKLVDEAMPLSSEGFKLALFSEGRKVETGRTNGTIANTSESEESFEENEFDRWFHEKCQCEGSYSRWEDNILESQWQPRDLKTLYEGKEVKTKYTVLDLAIFSGKQEVRQLVEEDLAKRKETLT